MNAKSTAEDKERWSKVRCWNFGKLGHTVKLCPEDDNPEAQAASKQAHTKRKEKWAQKNDSTSTVSTISTVSVNSSASAAATQVPPPSAAFTYETTEKPRPVGHADITGWTRSPTNAELTYLHTIAPCIMTVTAVDKGARFLFSTSEAMSAAKAVLENMRHEGKQGAASYYNEGTSVTASMGCSVLGRGAEPLVRTQFLEHPPTLNFGANHLKKWIQHPQKPPIPFLSPHNPHCRGGFWGGGSKS